MSILSVIQEVTDVIGLARPSSVFGSTDRDQEELGVLANEMAQRIAFDTADWRVLKTLATINGDGSTTSFALPTDYQRMLKDGALYSSTMPFNPLYHVSDANEWLSYEVQNFSTIVNRWTLIGTNVVIKPFPANASTVKYFYISKLIVDPVSGVDKTAFTIDTDVFKLDERLLKLGMIWQWLANKGRPYDEHMENYETTLAMRIGEDKGPAIMVLGKQRIPSDVRVSWPGVIVG